MIFEAALKQMTRSNSETYGPASFQDYLQTKKLPIKGTAPAISVDSLDRLSPELRAAGVMVFRLGRSVGIRLTQFELAKCQSGWDDYFLDDAKLFSSVEPEIFIPTSSERDLFVFRLMPVLTETTYVNLALIAGLLGNALELDEPDRPIVPATGQSAFSFSVRPHRAIDVVWTHDRGQVEIDAIFIAQRNGKNTLFVIEAKTSSSFSTLAKHKLVYPVLALAGHVPSYLEIVPVYMRVIRDQRSLHFIIAECAFDETPFPTVAGLVPLNKARRLVLEGYGGS